MTSLFVPRTIALVAGIALALTAFGLLGSPGPAAAQAGCSFAGSWTSDYGRMELMAAGPRISGTYHNGRATVEATQTGNRASGRWFGGPAFNFSEGTFEWTMAPNCGSFTGRFGEGSNPPTNAWNGTRIGDIPPTATPTPTPRTTATPAPPYASTPPLISTPLSTPLGQRDFDAFCRWYWDGWADGAALDDGTWFCITRDLFETGIEVWVEIDDIDEVCQHKLDRRGARARQQAAGDPFSWTCVSA